MCTIKTEYFFQIEIYGSLIDLSPDIEFVSSVAT